MGPVNPEIEYRRLVSGDAAAVRARADTLDGTLHDLAGLGEDLLYAEGLPRWSGAAADAYAARAAALRQGLAVTRSAVVRARAALDLAATAYEGAVEQADHYIAFWRDRPAGLPPVIEELFARAVNGCLVAVGRGYNQQLAGIRAAVTGSELDLEALDEETRTWVEEGLAKNEEWLRGNDSGLGPLIPNTAATGDPRGLVPQGLGYDPTTGLLLQGYYQDAEGRDPTHLALIDQLTGQEVGEVRLGEWQKGEQPTGPPSHAGGVTVVGNKVLVTDNGTLYTYSLDDIRRAGKGGTVPQAAPPQSLPGGSYSAYRDGRLYLGDFESDRLYVYERGPGGTWTPAGPPLDTPPQAQGVLVRDGELVFSTSYGRHQDHSTLVVQDDDGHRSDPYELPSMAQGVVEIDGELVVTYESTAEKFDHPDDRTAGWWWGRDDYQDLWANPYMTRTPLAELGLDGAGGEFEVEPSTLGSAAAELGGPAAGLGRLGNDLNAVRVPGHLLGEVPQAAAVGRTVEGLTGSAADSLRAGARAVRAVAELLRSSARDYSQADGAVDRGLRRMTPD